MTDYSVLCVLTCFIKVEPGETEDKVIVFFKIRPDVITPDNLHKNVFVSTMLDSPVSALYHAVQKVYAPVLLKDAKWSKAFDPKLQNLLTELEAGLGTMIRKQDPTHRGPVHDGDENKFAGMKYSDMVISVSWQIVNHSDSVIL